MPCPPKINKCVKEEIVAAALTNYSVRSPLFWGYVLDSNVRIQCGDSKFPTFTLSRHIPEVSFLELMGHCGCILLWGCTVLLWGGTRGQNSLVWVPELSRTKPWLPLMQPGTMRAFEYLTPQHRSCRLHHAQCACTKILFLF